MYDQLISFGQEIEPQLRKYFSSETFLGVSLDLDEYWQITEMITTLEENNHIYPYHLWYLNFRHTEAQYYSDYIRYIYNREKANLSSKVNLFSKQINWERYCKINGYPENLSPVIIRVKPKLDADIFEEEFINISDQKFRVIYEKNGPIKLIKDGILDRIKSRFFKKSFYAPAILVKKPRITTGTAGGLLYGEKTKRIFLVSCAHVMRQTGNFVFNENNKSMPIAEVIHTAIPAVSIGINPCNDKANSDLNSVDIALAQINTPLNKIEGLNKLVSPNDLMPIHEMSPHTKVSFIGKSSGRVEARLGPLTLWHNVGSTEGQRCFGRIFQLIPVDRPYIISDLAQPGDSGAWIILNEGLYNRWCGVIIAAENGNAYGCFAETIIENVNSTLEEKVVIYQNDL